MNLDKSITGRRQVSVSVNYFKSVNIYIRVCVYVLTRRWHVSRLVTIFQLKLFYIMVVAFLITVYCLIYITIPTIIAFCVGLQLGIIIYRHWSAAL